MPGLIQKSGYIKPGNGGGHYAEYIATREGVELIEAPSPSHDGGGYLEYMAQRPRSHGLFSADGPADLENTMEEINGHTGPVWTFVYSLKREDAHRLGYENSESWRKLLLAHQTELAQAMKISPKNFRWRAAFHDEKHHPHIHMMVWSADPKQGFLTEKGIEKMRSQLSNEIFRDELLSLYQKKDLSYSQVRDAAMEAMGRLIREMETGLCHSPVIMEQMETLAGMLENHKGKKVYGYLKKPVKAQVDAIVDELAKIPEVAECYEQWNQLRDELERYYKDAPREHLPLSQQKEFKAIKNMVIREAERLRLGTFTFEDARMRDEVDEDQDAVYFAWDSDWQMTEAYQSAKEVLEEYENPEEEKAEQVQVLEQLWQRGFSLAAYQLGKCWRDGRGVLPDDEQAEQQSYIKTGLLLHYLFSNIETVDDVDSCLHDMEMEGLFDESVITPNKLKNMLHKRFSNPKVKEWFGGGWTLFNECSILSYDPNTDKLTEHRPDRVMKRGDEVQIVDFKFGKPQPEHTDQVRRYISLTHDMGYTDVKGYLWYVYSDNIVEV